MQLSGSPNDAGKAERSNWSENHHMDPGLSEASNCHHPPMPARDPDAHASAADPFVSARLRRITIAVGVRLTASRHIFTAPARKLEDEQTENVDHGTESRLGLAVGAGGCAPHPGH